MGWAAPILILKRKVNRHMGWLQQKPLLAHTAIQCMQQMCDSNCCHAATNMQTSDPPAIEHVHDLAVHSFYFSFYNQKYSTNPKTLMIVHICAKTNEQPDNCVISLRTLPHLLTMWMAEDATATHIVSPPHYAAEAWSCWHVELQLCCESFQAVCLQSCIAADKPPDRSLQLVWGISLMTRPQRGCATYMLLWQQADHMYSCTSPALSRTSTNWQSWWRPQCMQPAARFGASDGEFQLLAESPSSYKRHALLQHQPDVLC